jgi:hypothetical protein
MDIEEETKSKPMAVDSGFHSGLARETIFRNEDTVGGAFAKVAGRTWDNIEDLTSAFKGGCGVGS